MKSFRSFTWILFATTLPLIAAEKSSIPTAVEIGMKLFSVDAMKAHDKFLASDLLEGRGPGATAPAAMVRPSRASGRAGECLRSSP